MTIYSDKPWTFSAAPNFTGRIIASDPTVLLDGSLYRMWYTDLQFNGSTYYTNIGSAMSSDGITWATKGFPLVGDTGDKSNKEASCIFRAGSKYVLMCSAYDANTPQPHKAALHIATSPNGTAFARQWNGLAPTVGWYDNDAIFSPTVIARQGGYRMVYCGHCYTDASLIGGAFGVRLLGATSSDGLTWVKHPTPIMEGNPAIPWMADGVAEPAIILGPDGKYYLFFTGIQPGSTRSIGIASSADPFGPWDINPAPIVTNAMAGVPADGVIIAPTVVLVNGVARMWYTEVTQAGYGVALAESIWS